MDKQYWLALAADGLLIVHALFIGFVVGGLLLIILGLARGWGWVRNPWLRGAHLAAIGVVTAQAWLGMICPLTIWENQLRESAGELAYTGTFVRYWLHRLIFYQAEDWVFTLCYSTFAAAVVLTWWYGPPAMPGNTRPDTRS